MSNFARAVSLSASGLVVVFGGFLILASAFYACPYGQSDTPAAAPDTPEFSVRS
jgi:hypothetical protein